MKMLTYDYHYIKVGEYNINKLVRGREREKKETIITSIMDSDDSGSCSW